MTSMTNKGLLKAIQAIREDERERLIHTIKEHVGLTNDEKRIVVQVIRDSVAKTGVRDE